LPETDDTRRRRIDLTLKLVSVAYVADDPAHNLKWLAEAEALARALPSGDKSDAERRRFARL
jgi:hypothetical protein